MQGWTASSSMASIPVGGRRRREQQEEGERRAQPPPSGPGADGTRPRRSPAWALGRSRNHGTLPFTPETGTTGTSPPSFAGLEETFKIIRFKRPASTAPVTLKPLNHHAQCLIQAPRELVTPPSPWAGCCDVRPL